MMGGQLCSQVVSLAMMGHLKGTSDRGRVVLLTMASIARDKSEKVQVGTYWGGWEPLAKVLGFPEYTPAAHRAVARALSELVAMGLVERLGTARPGEAQAYRLSLPSPLDRPRDG